MTERPLDRLALPAVAVGSLVVPPLALLAGASPLLPVVPVLCVLAGVYLLRRPATAVQTAVVVVLLPAGLLPTSVQSVLELASVFVAAGAWLLAARSQVRPVAVTAPTVLLLAFVAWSLFTLTWAPDLDAGGDVVRRYALGVLLLALVVDTTTRQHELGRLLAALSLAGWVLLGCSLVAMAQGSATTTGRLQVLDVNANQLGNVLLLASAGVVWSVVRSDVRRPGAVLLPLLFLGTSLVVIAQSGSRGSLVGYLLLAFCFVVTRTLRPWGLAAAVVAGMLLVAAPSVIGKAVERFRINDPEQISRFTLWSAGLELAAEHPLGVGPAAGPQAMTPYLMERIRTDQVPTRQALPAHNPLIEVAAESGVPGVVLYGGALGLGLGGFLLRLGAAQRRGDADALAYGAVVGSASAAFLVVWFKSGGEAYNWTTFLLLALWSVAPAASRPAVQGPDDAERETDRQRRHEVLAADP